MTKRLQHELLHLIILIFPLDSTGLLIPALLHHLFLIPSRCYHFRRLVLKVEEIDREMDEEYRRLAFFLFHPQKTLRCVIDHRKQDGEGRNCKGNKKPFCADNGAVLFSGQVTNPEMLQDFVQQKSCFSITKSALVPASRPRHLELRTSDIKEAWRSLRRKP